LVQIGSRLTRPQHNTPLLVHTHLGAAKDKAWRRTAAVAADGVVSGRRVVLLWPQTSERRLTSAVVDTARASAAFDCKAAAFQVFRWRRQCQHTCGLGRDAYTEGVAGWQLADVASGVALLRRRWSRERPLLDKRP